MSNPIRVGLIRCDTHGMWYGPQMMPHDARLLERATMVPEEQDYETWLRRGVHYFFYTYYCFPERMTAPRVEGFEIVKIWDKWRRAAEIASQVFHGKPQVCDRFEQVSDGVDLVFIADCNGDGSDHLDLATPGLQKRVPTFIDKPFAHCLTDAKRILELSRRCDTPVTSLSILQTNPATRRIRMRLDAGEVGKVDFGTITCHSTHPAGLIHAISIAHTCFGTGIKAVTPLVAPKHTALHLDYGDRTDRPVRGVVINCGTSKFRFTEMFVCGYGPEGALLGQAMDDFDCSQGSAIILEHCRDMVQTRQSHPLTSEMVQAVAVMDAARQAERTGRTAAVAEAGDF